MSGITSRHQVVIVGGGTAGITVAAHLSRSGVTDLAVIEPSNMHYYQPLWTLVGGGRAQVEETARPERDVMPKRAKWYQDAAVEVDPEARTVGLRSGGSIGYDFLVVAPGVQANWDEIPGLSDTLGRNGVSSNYSYETAPATWNFIRNTRSGTAVFTMPSTPIKCGGAPLKIAFLACDYWRKEGVLDNIQVILALGTPTIFKVEAYIPLLEQVAKKYGIDVQLSTELVEVQAGSKQAVLRNNKTNATSVVNYDMMHVTPPQSAPDWLKGGPLSDPADKFGFVTVDKETLRHTRYPEIFAIGDASNLPTSKTGAAIRKQAPALAANLHAAINNKESSKRYNGYTSCPVVTARNRMLLAEFDYSLQPTPSIPVINTKRERYDMWLLKRYGLPALYWNLMLKGRA